MDEQVAIQRQPSVPNAAPNTGLPFTISPTVTAMGDSTPWDKGRTPGAGAEQSRPVVQEDQTVLAVPESPRSPHADLKFAPSVLDLADKHPKPLDETVSGWPGISVPSDKCSAFNAAVFPSVEINETVQEDETHDQRESVDPFEDDEQPDEELRQYSDPENEDDMATGTRDSGYRGKNLDKNHIKILTLTNPLPSGSVSDHVRSVLQMDRTSPGPSPDQLRQQMNRTAFFIEKSTEADINNFLMAHVFPDSISDRYGDAAGINATSNLSMRDHLLPKFQPISPVVTPKPDLLYAYTSEISEETRSFGYLHEATCGMLHPTIKDFTNSGKSGMAYPFLVGEFKSSVTLGNLYVAVNQLAGAVAACLNAVHQLNATLAEIGKKKNSGGGTPPCMVENIAYGMAIDADQAKIYIGWMELKNGVPYYYLRQVERYTNTEPGDFVVFCQRVRNILDWAKTTRRESICNALDIVRRANCGPGPPVAWAATVRSGPSAGADPQTGDKRARALDDTGSNGNSKRRDNNSGKGQFNQDL